MKRSIVVVVMVVLLTNAGAAQSTKQLDVAQARLFLRFLDAVAQHHDAHVLVDSVMNAPGTALIIAQQNLARRISAAEYRDVLLAFSENRQPKLEYDRADARAAKGAAGLLGDVVPEMKWALDHRAELQSNLAAISAMDIEARAVALALDNLPERVPLKVPLFIVMGGRAGAAALDSAIYFDALVTSFRTPGHTIDATQVTEYFAHELHHVGLDQLIEREQRHLKLAANEERAFSLLSGLVTEGSASYLINGHRDLAAMQRDPRMAAPGTDAERLKNVERVLTGVLESGWSATQYDEAMAQFSGNVLHMTGAAMLDPIWRKSGRKAVLAVVRDPRQLLVGYNAAVKSHPDAFRFSATLANRIAGLGTTR